MISYASRYYHEKNSIECHDESFGEGAVFVMLGNIVPNFISQMTVKRDDHACAFHLLACPSKISVPSHVFPVPGGPLKINGKLEFVLSMMSCCSSVKRNLLGRMCLYHLMTRGGRRFRLSLKIMRMIG